MSTQKDVTVIITKRALLHTSPKTRMWLGSIHYGNPIRPQIVPVVIKQFFDPTYGKVQFDNEKRFLLHHASYAHLPRLITQMDDVQALFIEQLPGMSLKKYLDTTGRLSPRNFGRVATTLHYSHIIFTVKNSKHISTTISKH